MSQSLSNYGMSLGISSIQVHRLSNGSIDFKRLGEAFTVMYTPEYLESCIVTDKYGNEKLNIIQDGDCLIRVIPPKNTGV